MTTGIILAAGLSRRMGAANKLLTVWEGKPLLRHIVDAALVSDLDSLLLVTGHEAEAVRASVPDVPHFHAERYAEGMGESLSVGAKAVGQGANIMILLGDMPFVTAHHITCLLNHASADQPVVATDDEGRRGHPVLFPKRLQPALANLTGDPGARDILSREACMSVPIGQAALRDFDTPQAFTR